MGEVVTNVPEYSVSEISGAVKRTLEGSFGRVRVRGEITELKRYPSGHIYLSLKDEGAKIAAVVWRSGVARLGLAPENGVEVIATGRITAYSERSTYQLVVERLEYAGAGALLARIEALRVRLAAEGLFEAARKRPLPRLPALVGVVTSSQGAVLHDIRTTIARRFPRDVLVWPVPVQGEAAPAAIARAIAGFERLPQAGFPRRPDVLIVARGGGSLEDLMAFNDEAVLREAAACTIPLISAVGHETDTTLIDFVSDRRAPTPTAAAELAVPVRSELAADLAHRAARLASGLAQVAQGARLRLQRAGARMPDLPSLLGQNRQRLDDRLHRLLLALPHLLASRRAALLAAERRFPGPHAFGAPKRAALIALERRLPGAPALVAPARAAVIALERRLPSPHGFVAPRRAALIALERRSPGPHLLVASARGALLALERRTPDPHTLVAKRGQAVAALAGALRLAMAKRLSDRHRRSDRVRLSAAPLASLLRERRLALDGLAARLLSVSHEAVLARGFALVLDRDGHAVPRAADIAPGARLTLRFADGDTPVRAETRPRQGDLGL